MFCFTLLMSSQGQYIKVKAVTDTLLSGILFNLTFQLFTFEKNNKVTGKKILSLYFTKRKNQNSKIVDNCITKQVTANSFLNCIARNYKTIVLSMNGVRSFWDREQ